MPQSPFGVMGPQRSCSLGITQRNFRTGRQGRPSPAAGAGSKQSPDQSRIGRRGAKAARVKDQPAVTDRKSQIKLRGAARFW